MADRKKVIEALAHCSCTVDDYNVCEDCPYQDVDDWCQLVLMKDAMEVLKEDDKHGSAGDSDVHRG